MNTLIVYYSLSGNTESIAKKIEHSINADVLKIETVEPYLGSYDEIVEQWQEEVNKKIKPDLIPSEFDPEEYDCIIIWSPTRRYTIAPAVLSFLSTYDWTEKTVIPFVTNWWNAGTAIEDIKKACIWANFECEKEILFDNEWWHQCLTETEEINEWIQSINEVCEN